MIAIAVQSGCYCSVFIARPHLIMNAAQDIKSYGNVTSLCPFVDSAHAGVVAQRLNLS